MRKKNKNGIVKNWIIPHGESKAWLVITYNIYYTYLCGNLPHAYYVFTFTQSHTPNPAFLYPFNKIISNSCRHGVRSVVE